MRQRHEQVTLYGWGAWFAIPFTVGFILAMLPALFDPTMQDRWFGVVLVVAAALVQLRALRLRLVWRGGDTVTLYGWLRTMTFHADCLDIDVRQPKPLLTAPVIYYRDERGRAWRLRARQVQHASWFLGIVSERVWKFVTTVNTDLGCDPLEEDWPDLPAATYVPDTPLTRIVGHARSARFIEQRRKRRGADPGG